MYLCILVLLSGSLIATSKSIAGVPQGSVLSPLLFSLHKSDIPVRKNIQIAMDIQQTCRFAEYLWPTILFLRFLNDKEHKLKWPNTYTLDAKRYDLIEGLVEDVKYWYTPLQSRVDYSNGSITIVTMTMVKRFLRRSYSCECHYESTEQGENIQKCSIKRFLGPVSPLVLPDADDFVFESTKDMSISNNTLYKFSERGEEYNTLYATYDNTSGIWIPWQYIKMSYDLMRHTLKEHVLWEFNEFKTEVQREDLSFLKNCKNLNTTQNVNTMDDVNKHLINIDHVDKTQINERRVGLVPFPYNKSEIMKLASELPASYDYRLLGAVTPVKDLKDCKADWSVSATSAVAGALALSNGGRLLRLSNQALIDCAWGFGTKGCAGGNVTDAYHWIMKHGLPTESDYGENINRNGICHINAMSTTYKIKGYTQVTPYNSEALKVALVNHGPISVSISIEDVDLETYTGGVIGAPKCDPKLSTHQVTLVGYNQLDGEEYWVVKFNKGRVWGIDGYLHLSTRGDGACITRVPTYPVA